MNTTVVLVTLVLYKLLLIGIGFWAERRTKNQEDFYLGGRGLGPVVGAVSYSASAASAWTLLGMSGLAYLIGLSALWIAAGAVLGSVIAWVWVAPRMMAYSRIHNLLTMTEFMAHGAEGSSRGRIVIVASIIILFSFIFYISSQFQGAGNTFALTFDMSASSSIWLGGIIILIYTMLGGFWAVSLTDTLQGILMLVTGILLPVAAYFALVDSFGSVHAALSSVYDENGMSVSGANIGLALIGMIIGNLAVGLGALGQPHLQARFMALKDKKALNAARYIGITWYAIVFFGMCFVGLAGHALVPEIANRENIFFELTALLFHPMVSAVLLAAVLSAIMSTADSMLLVSGATVSHDLGLANRHPSKEMLLTRLTIAGLSVISILVAIYLPADIFSRVLFAWTALGAAFGPILIVRLMGYKFSGSDALAAMVGGFVLAVIFYLNVNSPGDWVERLVPFSLGMLFLLIRGKRA